VVKIKGAKTFLKYFLVITFTFFLAMLFFAAPAKASSALKIVVDNQEIAFDVAPYINEHGRTMVPIRFVSESLGAGVDWNHTEKEVTITATDKVIKLWIGKDTATLNGHSQKMDTVPVINGGRTFVPVRFVSDFLGAATEWNETSRTVFIASPKELPEPVEEPGDTSPVNPQRGIVSGNGVRVRQGPGLDHAILGQYSKGTVVSVTGYRDGWYYVEGPDGLKGWMSATYVSINNVFSSRSLSEKEVLPYLKGKTIVIDPGHGAKPGGIYDPGAIGATGTKEADINLALALKVRDLLTSNGAKVILTREDETTPLSLEDRSNIANSVGADVFVSIHCDSFSNPDAKGTTTFFYAPSDKYSLQEREKRWLLANCLQKNLVEELKRADRGVKESNLAVLRNTKTSCALVEVAFISNPEEEALLNDSAFQQRAAKAIVKGIAEYFYALANPADYYL